jgi:hypothetical protein
MLSKSIPLAALALLTTGCASWQACGYWVSGPLISADSNAQLQEEEVVAKLDEALGPLGFGTGYRPKHTEKAIIFFSLGSGIRLGGDRIDVRFEPNELRISVRDYERMTQSDLDKRVVSVIQSTLQNLFQTSIEFKQVTRCII